MNFIKRIFVAIAFTLDEQSASISPWPISIPQSHPRHGITKFAETNIFYLLLFVFCWFNPTATYNNGNLQFTWNPAYADSVQYNYDALGRVIEVTNATTSQSTQYSYDAVGNITTTSTIPTGTLSIAGTSINQAPAGSQITIYGTGFSTTPSSNAVAFNGVTATVVSSTTTQIVVIVPAGATTGLLTVTTTSSTSSANFAASSSANSPPTITNFSPAVASSGDLVTINGTNFMGDASLDKILFNGQSAGITSVISANSVSALMSQNASTGPITITTPYGSAVSSANLVVPPPGYAASSVGSTATVTINGLAQSLTATSAKPVELAFFSATAGSQNLRVVAQGNVSGSVEILDPSNTVIVSPTSLPAIINLPTLTSSGTYTVLILSSSTTSASEVVAVTQMQSSELRMDWGDTYDYTTAVNTTGGQVAALTFNGDAGESIQLQVTSHSGAVNNLSVINSSGAIIWQSQVAANASTTLNIPALPIRDSYTLLVDPGYSLVSMQYTAGVVPNSAVTVGATTLNSVRFAPYTYGQRARIVFNGSAGQNILLWLSTGSGNGVYSNSLYYYSLQTPTQRTYVNPTNSGVFSSQTTQLIRSLPATATYYLELSGSSGAYSSFNFLLQDGYGGNLSINGSAVSLALTPTPTPFFLVSLSGGQSLPVTARFASGCPYLTWQLIDPNGNVTAVGSPALFPPTTQSLGTPALAGTYYLALLPINYTYSQVPYAAPAVYSSAYSPGNATNTYPSANCSVSLTRP